MAHPFSDEDRNLLTQQFRIREPQSLAGLTLSAKRGVKAKRILYWYNEATPDNNKPVLCAFGHPHGKGLVVELEDDSIILVGHTCALKDFGFDIGVIMNDFDAAQDRQFQLLRLVAIREALPGALRELCGLKYLPAVLGYDAYWRAFQQHFGELHSKLQRCVKTNVGRLVNIECVRDGNAEEKAARKERPELFKAHEKADPSRKKYLADEIKKFIDARHKRYKNVSVDLGQCASWQLLDPRSLSPRDLIADVVATAESLGVHRLSSTFTKRDFAKVRNGVDRISEKLANATARIDDLYRFTSEANIALIAQWARGEGLDIIAEGRTLIAESYVLAPPALAAWPKLPQFERLEGARAIRNEYRERAA